MACKNCKKNSKLLTSKLKTNIKNDFLNIFKKDDGSKTQCEEKREKTKEWLNLPTTQSLLKNISLNFSEKVIIWLFGFVPLLVGYITILWFIFNLF
jgi:hypothetical protein